MLSVAYKCIDYDCSNINVDGRFVKYASNLIFDGATVFYTFGLIQNGHLHVISLVKLWENIFKIH